MVPGARTDENALEIVVEEKPGHGGRNSKLMISDEFPVYACAIKEMVPFPPGRQPGWPRIVPEHRLPDDLVDATVHKHRVNNA